MPIDLTGIANENEFYTHHYLSAILENDLKQVSNNGNAESRRAHRPPYAELRGLSRNFFEMRSRLGRERKPEGRLEMQHEFLQQLLPVLGYGFAPP